MSEFPNYDVLMSLKIVLTSAKNVDPDEIPFFTAFHIVPLFAKVPI